MAYTRYYQNRIDWEDEPSQNTALSAENLNKMDYAVYKHDETFSDWDNSKANKTVVDALSLTVSNLQTTKADKSQINAVNTEIANLQTTKANQSDLLQDIKSVTYNSSTGVWTFTHQNGTVNTFDQNIEKIPVSFSMSPQGIITMTTADGTTFTADIASLIKTYTFNDSSVIDFTTTTDASGNKTITASIIDGSITEQQLQPQFLSNCRAAQTAAETAATTATNQATAASSSATAAANSATTASTKADEAATNATIANTKANEASTSATNAANSATSASSSATTASNSATQANTSATTATTKATEANAAKLYSEAYAIGTEGGTPVPSTHPAYNNYAKYYTELAKDYAEDAEAIVGIGIATTEKAGIVKPDGETIFVDVAGKIIAGISENDWTIIQNLLV